MSEPNYLRSYIRLMINSHHETYVDLAHRIHCHSNTSITARIDRHRDVDLQDLDHSAPYLLQSDMIKIVKGDKSPFKVQIAKARRRVHDRNSFMSYIAWVLGYFGETMSGLHARMDWGRSHVYTTVKHGAFISAVKMCRRLREHFKFNLPLMIHTLNYAGMPLQTKRYRFFKLHSYDFPSQKKEVVSRIHDRDTLQTGFNTLMYLNGYTIKDLSKAIGCSRFYISSVIKGCSSRKVQILLKRTFPYLHLTKKDIRGIMRGIHGSESLRRHLNSDPGRRRLHDYLKLVAHAHNQTFEIISQLNGYRKGYLANVIYQYIKLDFQKIHRMIPYISADDMIAVCHGDLRPYRQALRDVGRHVVDQPGYLFYLRSVLAFHGWNLKQVSEKLCHSPSFLSSTMKTCSNSLIENVSCRIAQMINIDPNLLVGVWYRVEANPSYRGVIEAIAKSNWMTLVDLSNTVYNDHDYINSIMYSGSLKSKLKMLRTLMKCSDTYTPQAVTVEQRLAKRTKELWTR